MIVITLDGGLVQDVLTDRPDKEDVVVIDYDTDCADEEDIVRLFKDEAVVRLDATQTLDKRKLRRIRDWIDVKNGDDHGS